VCGGEEAVIAALTRSVGERGTIVMPTQTTHLSDPSEWQHPSVPERWWQLIRDTMPAFDPASTPTRGMGAIAENFRTHPGVCRSNHPQVSVAARGPAARWIVEPHPLDFGLGDDSPLARLHRLGAKVLLLGTGHRANTSLHLAEYRVRTAYARRIVQYAPVMIDGRRRWTAFQDLDLDNSDFDQLGAAYAAAGGPEQRGWVAEAPAVLIELPPLIEFAIPWLERNRRGGG
jgi:aminoglycoside 3-N-acetyltransferase